MHAVKPKPQVGKWSAILCNDSPHEEHTLYVELALHTPIRSLAPHAEVALRTVKWALFGKVHALFGLIPY